jgi:paraquat-inducible protein B
MAAARPAVVGGFVLGALALGVAAILFFGGSRLFAPRFRAVAFFHGSVAGLEIGAPVTFRGVRIGSVQHIELNLLSSGQLRIPVTLEFAPELVTLNGKTLREGMIDTNQFVNLGLRAQLALQSFVTGQLRVDLDFLPGTPVNLESVPSGGIPQVPTLPSDLERLRASLSDLPIRDLGQKLLSTLDAINRLANHLDAQLDPLADSTRQVLDKGSGTLDTIKAAVAQLQEDASHTVAEANILLTDATHQLDSRSADTEHLLHSADRMAQHADSLLSTLNGLVEPRSGFRSNLEASSRDLAATIASLRELARTLERDPGIILRGRNRQ